MARKLNTLLTHLGKQVNESRKIKGDNEITDDAKKETNKHNMSGLSRLIFGLPQEHFAIPVNI